MTKKKPKKSYKTFTPWRKAKNPLGFEYWIREKRCYNCNAFLEHETSYYEPEGIKNGEENQTKEA